MSNYESLPRTTVEIAGSPLEARTALALTEVRVLHRLSLPALCELTFEAPGGGLPDGGSMSIGDALRVAVNAGEVLFEGEVTGLNHAHSPSGGHEIRIRGFDLLHRLRKRQSIRALANKSLRQLAQELVAHLDLDVDIDDREPVWPKIVQWRQTDLELLTDTANRCGQYFTLCDGIVRFVTLAGVEPGTRLELGKSLLEVEIDANAESACRHLEVHAWDPWRSELCTGSANEARNGRCIPLDVDHARVGSDALCAFADETLQSGAEATCVAQAELDRRVAAEVVCRGIAAGNAALRPGNRINLRGVNPSFSGDFVLTSVTHSIDRKNGFRSAFDTHPPVPAKRERGTLCTLGHVLDADDPERLGRVKVSLPGYAGVESDWFGVVTPGAGGGKGLVCIPDKGDRVLVLMPRSDPAQGIVLGGLYGTQTPPDSGIEDGRVQRFTFTTPGGQRLRLDDDKKSVCVETAGGDALLLRPGYTRLSDRRGNYVEMNSEHVRVHSSADLELEAPGGAVVIRGAKIDFERA